MPDDIMNLGFKPVMVWKAEPDPWDRNRVRTPPKLKDIMYTINDLKNLARSERREMDVLQIPVKRKRYDWGRYHVSHWEKHWTWAQCVIVYQFTHKLRALVIMKHGGKAYHRVFETDQEGSTTDIDTVQSNLRRAMEVLLLQWIGPRQSNPPKYQWDVVRYVQEAEPFDPTLPPDQKLALLNWARTYNPRLHHIPFQNPEKIKTDTAKVWADFDIHSQQPQLSNDLTAQPIKPVEIYPSQFSPGKPKRPLKKPH